VGTKGKERFDLGNGGWTKRGGSFWRRKPGARKNLSTIKRAHGRLAGESRKRGKRRGINFSSGERVAWAGGP